MPKKTSLGMRPACRFCGIVTGSEPAFVVYRDELSVAFLDYRPLALGHVLLVPVGHYATLEALPDELAAGLAIRIKRISSAVIAAMDADGSFVGLNNRISQSVPHVHFHIVPRKKGDGLFAYRMIWKRVAYRDDGDRTETAKRIQGALQKTTVPQV
jgi:histidine triad (HIT) family protein